jgi:hypothetical protein
MRGEVAGGWGKNYIVRSFMICTLQGGQVKEDEVDGAFNRVGELRNVYKILAGKPEGDHIQMDMRSGGSSVKFLEGILR